MKAAFKAIEDHELGADELRGQGGPVWGQAAQNPHPMAPAMLAACSPPRSSRAGPIPGHKQN